MVKLGDYVTAPIDGFIRFGKVVDINDTSAQVCALETNLYVAPTGAYYVGHKWVSLDKLIVLRDVVEIPKEEMCL